MEGVVRDGEEAERWCKGTEAEREGKGKEGNLDYKVFVGGKGKWVGFG